MNVRKMLSACLRKVTSSDLLISPLPSASNFINSPSRYASLNGAGAGVGGYIWGYII